MAPKLIYCGLSDIGFNRAINQDVWLARPEIGWFILADGMGGRKAGEVAAQEAAKLVCNRIESIIQTPFPETLRWEDEIHQAMEDANKSVYQMGMINHHLRGMGTTVCCLLWTDRLVYYAHVGDSRIYRYRNGRLELLTRDHSLLEKWLSSHQKNTPTPPKNIITRAIGTSRPANPEISSCSFQEGDLFYLCSDGLSDALSQEEMQTILANAQSVPTAAKKMIDCAKKRGSGDNITILMIASEHALKHETVVKNDSNLSR